MAPAGTPPETVDKLYEAVSKVINQPKMRSFLEAQGLTPEGTSPATYTKQIQTDMARWNNIVKTTGMQRM